MGATDNQLNFKIWTLKLKAQTLVIHSCLYFARLIRIYFYELIEQSCWGLLHDKRLDGNVVWIKDVAFALAGCFSFQDVRSLTEISSLILPSCLLPFLGLPFSVQFSAVRRQLLDPGGLAQVRSQVRVRMSPILERLSRDPRECSLVPRDGPPAAVAVIGHSSAVLAVTGPAQTGRTLKSSYKQNNIGCDLELKLYWASNFSEVVCYLVFLSLSHKRINMY